MILFFVSTDMIYIHCVPTGQTVNKECYVKVLREFSTSNRVSGISTRTHPPDSPDLAPCDFCLFPKLQKNLSSCRYETIEEMKVAVMKVIDMLKQEDFHGTFQESLERYKCIAAGGDYFEGD